jgi:hypothetical protein
MKSTISRIIAVFLLIIPGFSATYGFLTMKNAIFAQFDESIGHVMWGKLLFGSFLFICGIAFIGGWTFYRDRKRNYLSPRFKK